MATRYTEITAGGRCYRLDRQAQAVFKEKTELHPVTPQNLRLLDLFVSQPKHTLITKAILYEYLYGNASVTADAVSLAVKSLRKALGPGFITTDHGRGYRMVADVQHFEGSSPPPTVEEMAREVATEQGLSESVVRTKLMPISFFRSIAVDGGLITKVIPDLVARNSSVYRQKLLYCHISVDCDDAEPFLEDDISMSYVKTVDDIMIRLPSGYMKFIADELGRHSGEEFASLCSLIHLKYSTVIGKRQFVGLDECMVEFFYYKDPDICLEDERRRFLFDLVRRLNASTTPFSTSSMNSGNSRRNRPK